MTAALSRWRSAKRAALRLAALLLVALALAAWAAPRVLTGRRFGRLVARALPAMSGQLTIGGVRWSWGQALSLWRGRPFDFALDDVRVIARDGVEVLRAGRVSGRLERRAAEHRLIVSELVVEDAAWRFDDAGDGKGIRFLTALRPPKRAGPSGGGSSFEVSIPNARLVRLHATFDFPWWGLSLDDVTAEASLLYRDGPSRPADFTFEVHGAEVRDGGRLRVGRPPSGWTLPFSKARLERVATTRDAPDAIQLEASNVVTGGSALSLSATFGRVYGLGPRVAPPGLTLSARLDHAPDALRAILAGHAAAAGLTLGDAAGADASLAVDLRGPYERLDITVDARGFAGAMHGVRVEPLTLHVDANPAERRLRIGALSATIPGVGTLDGGLTVELSAGEVALHDVALAFKRAATAGASSGLVVGLHSRKQRGPRATANLAVTALRVESGALLVDGLSLPLAGGVLTARGRVDFADAKTGRWLGSPRLDLVLDGRGLDLGQALGADLVQGTLAFRARVHGPLWGPRFDVSFPTGASVTLFGTPFSLPRGLSFLLTEGATTISLPLEAPGGGAISASGRVALSGAVDLELDMKDFPLAHLPGVATLNRGPTGGVGLSGVLWGQLRLRGSLSAPDLSGRLQTGVVELAGRRLGGGALAISTEPSGALRGRGQLVDGLRIDGTLRAGRGGPSGEVKLDLENVGTDAEIALPGNYGLRGAVSGTLVGKVAPHQPSSLVGVLSKARLSVSPRGAPAGAVTLSSTEPFAVSLRSDGASSLGPARLAGPAGTFEVSLDTQGASSRATLRGHLELAPLASLLTPWLRAPTGALDVDLVARAVGASPPTLEGTVAIARATSLAFVQLPLDAPVRARLDAGRARFDGLAIDVRDVAATVSVRAPSPSPVTTIEGAIGASGRVVRSARGATVSAQVDVRRAELAIPALGDHAALVEGGRVQLAGALDALGLDALTELDIPLRGAADHVKTPAGTLDRATYALRLRGQPGRTLTLSGDVDVLAAHVRRDAASATPKARANANEVPSLTNPRLDVHVHARHGAIEVALAHAPDLRVDLELAVSGTVAHPVVSGAPHASGIYSSIVMGLGRLFGAK